MPFRVRNLFYLRLSSREVIPLYLYLDERHVDWMSERTLQSVVADLKPLVGPKLEAERNAYYGQGGPANAKKGTVEVHQGDSYQFAYFLRKAESHSIVLKTRNYVMVNRTIQSKEGGFSGEPQGNRGDGMTASEAQSGNSAKGTKRPRKGTTRTKSQRKKAKGKAQAVDVIDASEEEETEESPLADLDEDSVEASDTSSHIPRRSTRSKRQRGTYREASDEDDFSESDVVADEDVEMQVREDQNVQVKQEANDDIATLRSGVDTHEEQHISQGSLPPDFGIDEDEEEKKLKPELQLSFRSLDMHDRCLCVVVEPWPGQPPRPTPFPATDKSGRVRDLSVAPRSDRAARIAPSRFSRDPELQSGREQTPLPLFLPDPSGRDRSATPVPARPQIDLLSLESPTIDDAQETMEDADDDFGMLAFSQVLNGVSSDRIGATEADDEMDGGALYGDADEFRGEFQ